MTDDSKFGAGRGSDTEGAGARKSRPTPSAACESDRFVLRERVLVAFTLAHNHPGIPGVHDGSCPRCNAEEALEELVGRAE